MSRIKTYEKWLNLNNYEPKRRVREEKATLLFYDKQIIQTEHYRNKNNQSCVYLLHQELEKDEYDLSYRTGLNMRYNETLSNPRLCIFRLEILSLVYNHSDLLMTLNKGPRVGWDIKIYRKRSRWWVMNVLCGKICLKLINIYFIIIDRWAHDWWQVQERRPS